MATVPRRRGWEIEANAGIDWLRAELDEAARSAGCRIEGDTVVGGGAAPAIEAGLHSVLERLDAARSCLDADRNSVVAWVRGTRVEGAWTNIHAAHARLLGVAGDDQLTGLLPDVRSAIKAHVPKAHPWCVAVDEWFTAEKRRRRATPKDGRRGPLYDTQTRELLSNALRQAYELNACRYTRLRRLRNVLVGSAALFAGGAVSLALMGLADPTMVPLCFEPPATGDSPGGRLVCPAGRSAPAAVDIALVAGFGVLGGALGGFRSLARSTAPTVASYSLRVARMCVKLSLGALAAIVGLLFLRAGFVPGFTALDSQAEILAYAVVFGSSQQLVTKLADRQGEVVLQATSNQAPDAGRDQDGQD